jgi:flagellar M-ring protein FliF
VVLTLRHRTLADGEDEAIRNLVAAAVDGLSPAQVTLVDANGHQPLGPKSADEMRQGLEQALEAKLIETLEPVTGTGNVRASVTVDYDPTSTGTTKEIYDPSKVVTFSMQRTEQSSGPQPVAAGVRGTASHVPNSQEKPVYPQQSTLLQTAKSESRTYGATKTVRHVSPGHLRRLTAAIVVNDRMLERTGGKNPAGGWQPHSAQELRNLTSLAEAAVGFDSARGDLVTVQDLTFDENLRTSKGSVAEQARSVMESSPLLLKYGSLLTGLLLLILLGIRPALKRTKQLPANAKKPEPAAPHAEGATAELAGAVPEMERQPAQHVFN